VAHLERSAEINEHGDPKEALDPRSGFELLRERMESPDAFFAYSDRW
jgi:hypothetical protein